MGYNYPYLQLKKHQVDVVQFFIDRDRECGNFIIGDEMGTGKSVSLLACAHMAFHYGLIDKLLIVCPASILLNWKAEVDKYFKRDAKGVCLYWGKKREVSVNDRIVITSYNLLVTDGDYIARTLGASTMMACDEAHQIKNYDTSRHKACAEFPAKYKIAMTGTPIANKPEDACGVLLYTCPEKIKDKQTFYNNFIITDYKKIGRNRYIPEIVGYRNQDRLMQVFSEVMIRRMRKDCIDLPDKTVQWFAYDSSGDRNYRNVSNRLDIDDNSMLVRIQYSQMALSGLDPYSQERELHPGCNKLDVLMDTIDEYQDERLIIWFKFEQTLSKVHEYLEKKYPKRQFFTHTGKVTKNKRQEIIEAWKRTPGSVLLATIKSAGVGLTLTECSTAVFYEMELSPAENKQAEDRIYRIGQANKVLIKYLYSKGTIEEGIKLLTEKKSKYNSSLIGDFTPEDLKEIYKFSLSFKDSVASTRATRRKFD